MAYIKYTPLPSLHELTDEEAKELLNAGMDILEREVRKNLKNAINKNSYIREKNKTKADLEKHLKRKIVKTTKGKRSIVLSFQGSVKRGSVSVKRNLIASVLESGKKGQPATHFMKNSLRAKESEIDATIEQKFNEIIRRNEYGNN